MNMWLSNLPHPRDSLVGSAENTPAGTASTRSRYEMMEHRDCERVGDLYKERDRDIPLEPGIT